MILKGIASLFPGFGSRPYIVDVAPGTDTLTNSWFWSGIAPVLISLMATTIDL